jgi:hypothetical protein
MAFVIAIIYGMAVTYYSDWSLLAVVATFALCSATAFGVSTTLLEMSGFAVCSGPERWMAAGAYGFMVVSWTLAAMVILGSVVS